MNNGWLRECLIVISGRTRAELAARIDQTRIKLIRAIVAVESSWTIAHVHVGQRLATVAARAVLTRIGRAVVNGRLA